MSLCNLRSNQTVKYNSIPAPLFHVQTSKSTTICKDRVSGSLKDHFPPIVRSRSLCPSRYTPMQLPLGPTLSQRSEPQPWLISVNRGLPKRGPPLASLCSWALISYTYHMVFKFKHPSSRPSHPNQIEKLGRQVMGHPLTKPCGVTQFQEESLQQRSSSSPSLLTHFLWRTYLE